MVGHNKPKFIIGNAANMGGSHFNTVDPRRDGSRALSRTKSRKEQMRPVSPTKSIYELVKQDIKMPEGLLFRGKYVGKSRNSKQGTALSSRSAIAPSKAESIFDRRSSTSNSIACPSTVVGGKVVERPKSSLLQMKNR
jgi:hypothetical protein